MIKWKVACYWIKMPVWKACFWVVLKYRLFWDPGPGPATPILVHMPKLRNYYAALKLRNTKRKSCEIFQGVRVELWMKLFRGFGAWGLQDALSSGGLWLSFRPHYLFFLLDFFILLPLSTNQTTSGVKIKITWRKYWRHDENKYEISGWKIGECLQIIHTFCGDTFCGVFSML